MELTTLRYFSVLAEELHFRRAAAKLHITQAPLSAAIKKLEDELDVKLFDRTSRSVRLTAEGELFAHEVKAVLSRLELGCRRLQEAVSGRCGKLSVGYNEPAVNSVLPGVLTSCRQRYPDMFLELREMETSDQLDLIRTGRLDLGLMRPAGFDLSGLSMQVVFREEYCLIMLPDDPLAKCRRISGRELSGRQLIMFARDINPYIYDCLTLALSDPELPPPHFRQDARNKNSMLAMVKAGFGAALIPESCCLAGASGLLKKKIDILLPSVEIMAVWDKDHMTGALAKFLPLLPSV